MNRRDRIIPSYIIISHGDIIVGVSFSDIKISDGGTLAIGISIGKEEIIFFEGKNRFLRWTRILPYFIRQRLVVVPLFELIHNQNPMGIPSSRETKVLRSSLDCSYRT